MATNNTTFVRIPPSEVPGRPPISKKHSVNRLPPIVRPVSFGGRPPPNNNPVTPPRIKSGVIYPVGPTRKNVAGLKRKNINDPYRRG